MTEPNPQTCREVVELLSDYLDGSLDEDLRSAVDRHLAGCDGCGRALVQLRETVRLTGMLREESLTTEQRDILLEAFRGWRGREG